MLLSQIKPKPLSLLWKKNNLPAVKTEEDNECIESNNEEKDGLNIKNFLAKHGIAICKIEVPKARDGMQKFSTLLEFHFNRNTFNKVDWQKLGELIKTPNKQKNLFGK